MVIASDLDGDGDLELVTANQNSGTVSILKNDGSGVFFGKIDYFVGNSPTSIAAADLNGDGHKDLSVTLLSDSITILINLSCILAPQISSIPPLEVIENESLIVPVSVYGSCPAIPTLSSLNLPPHSSFSDSGNGSGVFTFTPSYTQSGTYYVTFTACDTVACDSETVQITVNCGTTKRGDPNGNGQITLPDIIYLTNYVFKGGPAPVPEKCDGDANNDNLVSIADIIYLVNYVFKDGPPPSPTTCCL